MNKIRQLINLISEAEVDLIPSSLVLEVSPENQFEYDMRSNFPDLIGIEDDVAYIKQNWGKIISDPIMYEEAHDLINIYLEGYDEGVYILVPPGITEIDPIDTCIKIRNQLNRDKRF